MNPSERQQVRLSILRHCLKPGTSGLVHGYLVAEGFRISRPEVELEIIYLEDKLLLVAARKTVSPELPLYRTTAEGRDYLATEFPET